MTDMTGREPRLNVADLAWVLVTTTNGTHERWTLRQVLSGARHAKRLNCSSPIERMALTRTLVAFMALVCREAGLTDSLDKADDLDDSRLATATDAVLDRHRDALYLDHPTKPFFQEWRHGTDDYVLGSVQDVEEKLRPEAVSSTSKVWWRRDRSTVGRPLTAEEVTPLLAAYWFASLGKNKTPLNNDIGQTSNFSLGTLVGNDAQFYWRHVDNLLATLLANLPLVWVTEQNLPVFLDRARSAPHLDSGLPSPLWSSTYSHNACLLQWDGPGDNSPAGVYTGISRWGFYGLRTTKQTQADKDADKELAGSLREKDFARFHFVGQSGKKERLSKFDPDAAVLVRLHDWYATLGARYLTDRTNMDPALWADSSDDRWTMDVFVAKVDMHGMSSSFTFAHWFDFDPAAYDLDSATWERINDLYENVVDNGMAGKQWRPGILGALLSEIKKPDGPARGTGGNQSVAMRRSLADQATRLFWSGCNKATSDHVNAVAHGSEADALPVLRAVRDVAIEIYDIVTAPLRSADRVFNIENSRARLHSNLYRIAPAPEEDTA